MKEIIGLTIRDRTIAWTLLREDKSGSTQRSSQTVLLDIEEKAASKPDSMAAALRRQCPELTWPISLGIPPDQTLTRVIDLPTVDQEEMPGMVQLQLDKLFPFPGDKMVSSFEVLKAEAASCRILIATVRRPVIEQLGEIFRVAGLDILRIDLEAMGWWQLLLDQNAVLSDGRHIIIILEKECGLTIAAQDGTPAAFRTIGPFEGLPKEERAAELSREASSMALTLDLEYGEMPVQRLDVWSRDAETDEIAAGLQEDFELQPGLKRLSDLPPLSEGLARRAARSRFSGKGQAFHVRGAAVIDLVPDSWRKAAAASLLKKKVITAFVAIFAIWIAGMGPLGIAYNSRRTSVRELEQHTTNLQGPADEARALQRQVRSLEQYLDRKQSALECLLELDQMRPSSIKLTSLQFKKGKNTLIRGESLDVEPIIDYKQRLDSSSLFEEIEMGSIQPKKRKEQTVQTFQMNAKIPEQAQ